MLHPEPADLLLDEALELLRAAGAGVGQRGRLGARRRRRLGHRALHLLRDRVVARDPVEGRRDLVPVGEDRGHRVAVLALELHDGVEPGVDLLEPLGIEDRAVAERAGPADHVLHVGLRALDRLDGRGGLRLVA